MAQLLFYLRGALQSPLYLPPPATPTTQPRPRPPPPPPNRSTPNLDDIHTTTCDLEDMQL